MSVGTSDSTVISSPKPEVHNPNTTIASAALRGDSSSATVPAQIPEYRPYDYLLVYNNHRDGNPLKRES